MSELEGPGWSFGVGSHVTTYAPILSCDGPPIAGNRNLKTYRNKAPPQDPADSVPIYAELVDRYIHGLEALISGTPIGSDVGPRERQTFREALAALALLRAAEEERASAAREAEDDAELDLDASRRDIGRRLDRLRATRDPGEVPEQPD